MRCFTVRKEHIRDQYSSEREISFCIGNIGTEYTLITKSIIDTDNNFYFYNSIKLNKRHFIAYRGISILHKIDAVVNSSVYIGGNGPGSIPIEVFELLVKNFPKSTELDYYAKSRISTLIKEFYPYSEKYETYFNKYIYHKDKTLFSIMPSNFQISLREDIAIEFDQFSKARHKLAELLSRADSVSEQVWQEQIHGLLRLLYPKYIAAVREVMIKGVDCHDKRPDFLLVDANGYIDILEIKKPCVQLLTKQSAYRNNYVPVRELAGAIQQIEKYIYCLNVWGRDGESELQKQLADKLPMSVTPKVVNPQGILLLGRSNAFNEQQRDDFELIRRQYKSIADIMTYDDFLQRIDNILSSLVKQFDTSSK